MNKLKLIEIEYNEKLKRAKIEENHDKILSLFFELNVLRKFYKNKEVKRTKKIFYIN